ncbi:hypothetical protein [Robiginitalea marina]|uniref:Uncharacterized protein n=1 Tax=Robiginitalea marina TaxID=2954105 RepID=A0ABT1B019_9FLAO|nr:hypothetical protein [Robiginitalea marina]MCO5725531.1 hypothetical protein [Robiginitalea marina]
MNKYLTFLLVLTLALQTAYSNSLNNHYKEIFEWNVFIPDGNGYVKTDINTDGISINNIGELLGYNTSQFSAHFKFDDHSIQGILFKVFTTEIICVITDDGVNKLTQSLVDDYLKDFEFNEYYDGYKIESELEEAVEKKLLSLEYLNEIFDKNLTDINGSFVAEKIGYRLFFKDGWLNDFATSDGLNKWAKSWKNNQQELYGKYLVSASIRFGGDQELVNYYINTQAKAFTQLPNGFRNEYVQLYKNQEYGTYNFKMIAVAHYNEKMTLNEFKILNKDEYEIDSEFNSPDGYRRTTYRLLNTLYTFDQDGNLINSYLSN